MFRSLQSNCTLCHLDIAATAVHIVQQRALPAEPSIPTPFLLAKEGIPKVQYDYTRGLDELNGIDLWDSIPATLNPAKWI